MNLPDLDSTVKLRERLNDHAKSMAERGDSLPPPPILRAEPLTPERCREIGNILQRHMLPAAFGISPAELAAFVSAAKKGLK